MAETSPEGQERRFLKAPMKPTLPIIRHFFASTAVALILSVNAPAADDLTVVDPTTNRRAVAPMRDDEDQKLRTQTGASFWLPASNIAANAGAHF